MCFRCVRITPQRTWLGSSTSQGVSFICKFIRCDWLCAGRTYGKLVPWSKGVGISVCCDMNSSNGSKQTQFKNNNMVYIGGGVLILLWFVQLCKRSERGLELSQIQRKFHEQFRNRDEYYTWFVLLIFKFTSLDLQNTFVILVVWCDTVCLISIKIDFKKG